jgi:hypothetical protein
MLNVSAARGVHVPAQRGNVESNGSHVVAVIRGVWGSANDGCGS